VIRIAPLASRHVRRAETRYPARFFGGLDLAEPGVVQPQQWRPDPVVISPDQVTAWCAVARKG
jgi:hypothetical protein